MTRTRLSDEDATGSVCPSATWCDTRGLPYSVSDDCSIGPERLQFLYWGLVDWESPLQRPQRLAMEFARRNRVIYTRMVSISSWVKARGRAAPAVEVLGENLLVLRIRVLSPGRYAVVSRVNNAIARATVRRYLRPGMVTVNWLSHPEHIALARRFTEDLACYDQMDFHAGFKRGRTRVALERMERRLWQRADLVFVSSRDLYARAEAGGAQPVLLPNAADVERFASAQTLTLEEPLDLAGIPHPRLLLYGTLRECVDARFLADVARERPSWQMVLIGPMAGMDVAPIARLPNVHLMGPRANERLPSYLQYSDICMIPYRDDDVTRAIDPVKVYEYLAAGKPVISTPLPELSRFEEVVTVVRTAPEFVATAERILSRPDPGKAVRQLQAVRDQSWDRRGSRAEELVRIALTQRIRHAHD